MATIRYHHEWVEWWGGKVNNEVLLTAVLALFVLVSVFLMAQQVVRERGTQTDNERLREQNDLLRRENNMLMVSAGRLIAQVERMEGIPEWYPAGTITPVEKNKYLNAMQTLFTREELMLLADDAGLDFDHITAQSLPGIALQLHEQARHKGIEARLHDAVRRERPHAKL